MTSKKAVKTTQCSSKGMTEILTIKKVVTCQVAQEQMHRTMIRWWRHHNSKMAAETMTGAAKSPARWTNNRGNRSAKPPAAHFRRDPVKRPKGPSKLWRKSPSWLPSSLLKVKNDRLQQQQLLCWTQHNKSAMLPSASHLCFQNIVTILRLIIIRNSEGSLHISRLHRGNYSVFLWTVQHFGSLFSIFLLSVAGFALLPPFLPSPSLLFFFLC